MPTTENSLVESRRLATLLIKTAERVKSDFAQAAGSFDVSVPVARALLSLDEPASMRSVAEQLSCDQSYVTSLADDLESHGLVTREPGEDRRVKVLTLTRSGANLRARLSRTVAESNVAMARLDATERATLAMLLARLVDEPD